jgi:hypothetical protein
MTVCVPSVVTSGESFRMKESKARRDSGTLRKEVVVGHKN